MPSNTEKFRPEQEIPKSQLAAVTMPRSVIDELYGELLEDENFENVAEASDSIESLCNFRKQTGRLAFASFNEAVEAFTHIDKLLIPRNEKDRHRMVVAKVAMTRAQNMSPRVADLYCAMLSDAVGEPYEAQFDVVRDKIVELKENGDLDLLYRHDVSWELKLNRIENRLTDFLFGIRALDRRERNDMDDDIRKWREEQLKNAPKNPPSKQKESRPGVDPMERLKEGEHAHAIWSMFPGYGGYYKMQSFSAWNSARNVWVAEEDMYSDIISAPLVGNTDPKKGSFDIKMRAQVIPGQWTTVPVPYTHGVHSVTAGKRQCKVQADQNGDIVIMVDNSGGEIEDVEVILAPVKEKTFNRRAPETVKVPEMPSIFSEETNRKLEDVTKSMKGNIAKADALLSYALSRTKYLAPKDAVEAERYNSYYSSHPGGLAGAVDEIRLGDCDVVNTYFAALCAKIGVPVRHCIGHMVKGADEHRFSSMNSGTGHGWSEIWDENSKKWVRWERKDATPAGDPNFEQQEGSMAVPGDYGTKPVVRPTDEELEELRKQLAERKETLKYTKEERQLAAGANIELSEARQIVREIREAELTRLPNGELIIDALSSLFGAIVESRRMPTVGYAGPVRESEGGEEITHIVEHYIQAKSGEMDPRSRELPTAESAEENIIGGFDVYFIGDKSGSMSDSVNKEMLWEIQRRALYLILSSLHRFERNIERAGVQKKNTLSVRTQSISFRGDRKEDIDMDKPLSSSFSDQDKVNLWHSLTEQGSGNGDVAALSFVYEQIKSEIETETKQQGGKKQNRLRLIIACSDGGPDDASKVQMLAEMLGKLNAVVVGIGLTETATAVPIIFNTPYSRGDLARDINDLPALVAKHLVFEAIKLFPEKARKGATHMIESAVEKFRRVV